MTHIDRRRLLQGALAAAPVLALSADSTALRRRLPAQEAADLPQPEPSTSGDGSRVSVTDYGAVGDGIADDTDAIIGARDAVLSSRINEGQVTYELFFPAGIYRVTRPDTLLSSPFTGNGEQVRGYTIRGMGKRTSEIFFDNAADRTDDAFANNLMTAANRVRGLRISNISFRSENDNNSWLYCWSRDADDDRPEEPAFGSGSNHDFVLTDVEWRGSWLRVVGLDGDQQSNLNSEWAFYNCHVGNTGAFGDGFLHSGMSPAHDQQDQFLNFWFYNCKFEYAHGTLLKFTKGGFVNVYGGSWIAGIDSQEPAVMFQMADVPHYDATQNLLVVGTRFELRHPDVRLLDTAWSGPSAHITFQNVSDSAQGFRDWAGDANPVVIHTRNGELPTVKFINCELMGYHRVIGSSARRGKIIYDGCNFTNNPSGGAGVGRGFLRYEGSPPDYRFVDCYGVSDANR